MTRNCAFSRLKIATVCQPFNSTEFYRSKEWEINKMMLGYVLPFTIATAATTDKMFPNESGGG